MSGYAKATGFKGSSSDVEKIVDRDVAELLRQEVLNFGGLIKFLDQFDEVIDVDFGTVDKNAVGAGVRFDDDGFSIRHDPGGGGASGNDRLVTRVGISRQTSRRVLESDGAEAAGAAGSGAGGGVRLEDAVEQGLDVFGRGPFEFYKCVDSGDRLDINRILDFDKGANVRDGATDKDGIG